MKHMLRFAFLVSCLSFASSARAQTIWETYVASYGDDVNNCARFTPCATFARAFAQTTGAGVIHVLDSGTYGRLTVTHSITIEGSRIGATTALDGTALTGTAQFLVNAGSTDVVTIRGFVLSGSRNAIASKYGIQAISVGALHVEDCVFNAFNVRAVDFLATSGYLQMKDVTITDMATGVGVYVTNARAALEHVAVHDTQAAVIAAGSATVSVAHSTFNGNGMGVAAAYGPTAQANVDDCVFSNNQWAVVVGGGGRAYVGRSSMYNNYIQALFNDGASTLYTYGNNQFASNANDGFFNFSVALK